MPPPDYFENLSMYVDLTVVYMYYVYTIIVEC